MEQIDLILLSEIGQWICVGGLVVIIFIQNKKLKRFETGENK